MACNELENLVNKERRKNGLRALHCDPNMRWVAYRHLDDAEEGAEGRHGDRERGRGHGQQAAGDRGGASLVAASQH